MNIRKEDEIIVVVPRDELFENNTRLFQGVEQDKETVAMLMDTMGKHRSTMRRGSEEELDTPLERNAELNTAFKQPIPYIIVKKGEKMFVTERLAGSGEGRLKGKLSMGLGGHMNEKDTSLSMEELIRINTERELEEEVYLEGEGAVRIIGLLNDDSDPTGYVHIGVLGFLELEETQDMTIKETDVLAGYWYTLEELSNPEIYDRLENWGKIVVDLLNSENK